MDDQDNSREGRWEDFMSWYNRHKEGWQIRFNNLKDWFVSFRKRF